MIIGLLFINNIIGAYNIFVEKIPQLRDLVMCYFMKFFECEISCSFSIRNENDCWKIDINMNGSTSKVLCKIN